MRTAYQGEPGAYSEAAAAEFHPGADLMPCPSFEAVFDAVSVRRRDRRRASRREHDRRQHPPQLRPARRARPADRRRGRGRRSSIACWPIPVRRAPRFAASTRTRKASPSASSSSSARRRRAGRRPTTRPGAPSSSATASSATPRRSPRAAPQTSSAWTCSSRASRITRPTSHASSSSPVTPIAAILGEKTIDCLRAAQRAGCAVPRARRVCRTTDRSDEARVAPDPGPRLGVHVLRRSRARPSRAQVRARARASGRIREVDPHARLLSATQGQ